jgi:hypothetical protein
MSEADGNIEVIEAGQPLARAGRGPAGVIQLIPVAEKKRITAFCPRWQSLLAPFVASGRMSI